MKVWLYIGIIAAVCTGIGTGFKLHGDARYREGRLEAINAQTKTDNLALIDSASKMVAAYEQTQEGLKELAQVDDKTTAGPAISTALDRLRVARKPNGDSPTVAANSQ